jgi:hypothetical protein
MLGLSTIRHRDTNFRPSAEPIECFLVVMVGGLFKNISKNKKIVLPFSWIFLSRLVLKCYNCVTF